MDAAIQCLKRAADERVRKMTEAFGRASTHKEVGDAIRLAFPDYTYDEDCVDDDCDDDSIGEVCIPLGFMWLAAGYSSTQAFDALTSTKTSTIEVIQDTVDHDWWVPAYDDAIEMYYDVSFKYRLLGKNDCDTEMHDVV